MGASVQHQVNPNRLTASAVSFFVSDLFTHTPPHFMTTIYIPTTLRRLTANQSRVDADGQTVSEVLQTLNSSYPGFGDKLFDETGHVKRFINVFVNDNEIRTLQGLDTTVKSEDKISIVPAMAGGC